jgi:hypothetical protein
MDRNRAFDPRQERLLSCHSSFTANIGSLLKSREPHIISRSLAISVRVDILINGIAKTLVSEERIENTKLQVEQPGSAKPRVEDSKLRSLERSGDFAEDIKKVFFAATLDGIAREIKS